MAGLASWARLADVPGTVDIVLVAGGLPPSDVVDQATMKAARALWILPGVAARDAEAQAREHGLVVVSGRDIAVEQRHTERVDGQPRKRGVPGRAQEGGAGSGWTARGGGGKRGGGGGRPVLDEKKMTSRRRDSRPRS